MMTLGPPGADPVADHTWCCEHPEPWNYFDPVAEARLLSGLSRVFRVDPVETSWSLRIAEWAGTEASQTVLREILAENAVTPKVRLRCERLLRAVCDGDDLSPPQEPSPDSFSELVDVLGAVRDEGNRQDSARILAGKLDQAESLQELLLAVSELLGMGHEAVDEIVGSWMTSPPAWSAEEEAHVLLSASASGRDQGFLLLESRLLASRRGFQVYDVYEAVRALMRSLPPVATKERLRALYEGLNGQVWWRATDGEEAGQMAVVGAALTGGETLRKKSLFDGLFAVLKGTALKGNYQQEALGYSGGKKALRKLKAGLQDPELFVRREAARALCRIGGEGAIQVLVAHVREQILPGHLALDIEGADVVRYAMDGTLENHSGGDADFLYEIFNEPSMGIHDLRQRAALGLCFLGDSRCMAMEESSHLPALIQAAISPLASESEDPLQGYLERTAKWLNHTYGTTFDVPEPSPTHLERVHLSREMVLWAKANRIETTQ